VTVGRVSQAAIEALLQLAPKARLSQQAGEALLQPAPRIRHGQQAIEVLRTVAAATAAGGARHVFIVYACD
jgi:hypothetical protein